MLFPGGRQSSKKKSLFQVTENMILSAIVRVITLVSSNCKPNSPVNLLNDALWKLVICMKTQLKCVKITRQITQYFSAPLKKEVQFHVK